MCRFLDVGPGWGKWFCQTTQSAPPQAQLEALPEDVVGVRTLSCMMTWGTFPFCLPGGRAGLGG